MIGYRTMRIGPRVLSQVRGCPTSRWVPRRTAAPLSLSRQGEEQDAAPGRTPPHLPHPREERRGFSGLVSRPPSALLSGSRSFWSVLREIARLWTLAWRRSWTWRSSYLWRTCRNRELPAFPTPTATPRRVSL